MIKIHDLDIDYFDCVLEMGGTVEEIKENFLP